MSRIESLDPMWYYEQAGVYERYAEAVKDIPGEDTLLTVGTVVTFSKKYQGGDGDKVYIYAAIKTIAGWYVTGHQPDIKSSGMTWRSLLDMIGLDNLWSVCVSSEYCTLRDYIERKK